MKTFSQTLSQIWLVCSKTWTFPARIALDEVQLSLETDTGALDNNDGKTVERETSNFPYSTDNHSTSVSFCKKKC